MWITSRENNERLHSKRNTHRGNSRNIAYFHAQYISIELGSFRAIANFKNKMKSPSWCHFNTLSVLRNCKFLVTAERLRHVIVCLQNCGVNFIRPWIFSIHQKLPPQPCFGKKKIIEELFSCNSIFMVSQLLLKEKF